jgi:hypothetical protein
MSKKNNTDKTISSKLSEYVSGKASFEMLETVREMYNNRLNRLLKRQVELRKEIRGAAQDRNEVESVIAHKMRPELKGRTGAIVHQFLYRGQSYTLDELKTQFAHPSLTSDNILSRIKYGWAVEKALKKPLALDHSKQDHHHNLIIRSKYYAEEI